MELTTLLHEKTIFLPLEVQTKEECLRKMTDGLVQAGFIIDSNIYLDAVFTRENLGSTGVGFGVAIPHGKSAGVSTAGLAFALLANPTDWQSLDGNPVSIVFLIAVPEEKAGNEHLQILAALSRKLIHEDFRDKLLAVKTADEVHRILEMV